MAAALNKLTKSQRKKNISKLSRAKNNKESSKDIENKVNY